MIRKVPIIGHPIALFDWIRAAGISFDKNSKEKFASLIARQSGSRFAFLMSSGIAAFYCILKSLKKLSAKQEVVLPAYTAPSLVVAIRKAGLKPVLCDISLKDFNADLEDLRKKITTQTLAVLAVHMFGIPWFDVVKLKETLGNEVFIIEDCAQAFGSRIKEKPVGILSDVGFYSFNRGKNLPTYDGGCIVTDSEILSKALAEEVLTLKSFSMASRVKEAFKLLSLCVAFKPFFYGLLYPLIARFKDNSVPQDFDVRAFTSFKAAFGTIILEKADNFFKNRQKNGLVLIGSLEGGKGIVLPQIAPGLYPVFNRLPVLIKDKARLADVIMKLDAAGIESSRLYLKPLHHIFDLGYRKDEFPNAVYLAEHLLTLPVHPLVEERDIEMMAKVIKGAVQ